MIRRFRSDREDHLDDVARRREQCRDRRRRPKIVPQLLGENAPEAMWRFGGSCGIVRIVSCNITVLMRCGRRGLNGACRECSERARAAVIRMVKAGERRGVVDHRRRTRCAHEQRLQEEHASRGKPDDADEDVLPERSRYHDSPVRLPFEVPGASSEFADALRPEEMTSFQYDNRSFRWNLATKQPEFNVPPGQAPRSGAEAWGIVPDKADGRCLQRVRIRLRKSPNRVCVAQIGGASPSGCPVERIVERDRNAAPEAIRIEVKIHLAGQFLVDRLCDKARAEPPRGGLFDDWAAALVP